MGIIKIESMGSVQTNINGKNIENKQFVFKSDGKKGHLIMNNNGSGKYYKINNINDIFNNPTDDTTLIKRLNKTLKKSKYKKKRRKKSKKRKTKKKKKRIFKFY